MAISLIVHAIDYMDNCQVFLQKAAVTRIVRATLQFMRVQYSKLERCYIDIVTEAVFPMTSFKDDNDVTPFTPLPANRIHVTDFLQYVASHQDTMQKYKDEFQVRS